MKKKKIMAICLASFLLLFLDCSTGKTDILKTTIETKRFICHYNGNHKWPIRKTSDLLEHAYNYYKDLFQIRLPYKITVKVSNAQSPAATNHLSSDGSRIHIYFPERFGTNEKETTLIYHFFCHELLHCWLGGNVVSHAIGIEALVKFQTDIFLFENSYISKEQFQQATINGSTDPIEIRKYKNKYYDMYKNENSRYISFIKDLADKFARNKLKNNLDVLPVYKEYFGKEIEEYSPSNKSLSSKLESLPKNRPTI